MRGHVLVIGLAVLAAACDPPDERRSAPERDAPAAVETTPSLAPAVAARRARQADAGGRRLAVVARLVELIDSRDTIVGSRCPIDGERRPALGCSAWRTAGEWRMGPDGPPNPLVVAVPPGDGPPKAQILQWSVSELGQAFDMLRPASILGASDAAVRVDPAAVAGPTATAATRITLRTRPTLPQRIVTSPVRVPTGGTLELGLAVDPSMPHDDVEAVVFAVSAETPAGEQPLLESRVAPSDPAAAHWTDHRIPLDPLVGLDVRFVFTTRLIARAGADPARLAALPLWGAPEILAPSDEPALDVILISFDTLRADHVGVYGSDLPTTPHLDRLAADGVVFDDVFATYPSTTMSHMSMLTGRLPIVHSELSGGRPLRLTLPSLATVLGARGWRTGAVTENGMLRADTGFSNGVSFYRELVEVEDTKESRVAAKTFDAAVRWITAHADERFFLFLHTYVVHWPYAPPAEFDVFKTWRRDGVERSLAEAPPMEQERHRYAGDARFGDALLGRLRTELERLGLAERTLVVVTSDHGEEFGEHGGWSHSHTLYDEVLHVPLIFWAPRAMGTPRRVAGPASLVDLMPTVLDVLDVPAPPDLDGRSLLEPAPTGRVVFAEVTVDGVRRIMARTGDGKWLWDYRQERVVEAFDLRADPGEQRSLADERFRARGAPLVADYLGRAPSMRVAPAEAPAPGAEPPVDPDIGEKLRALGYVK